MGADPARPYQDAPQRTQARTHGCARPVTPDQPADLGRRRRRLTLNKLQDNLTLSRSFFWSQTSRGEAQPGSSAPPAASQTYPRPTKGIFVAMIVWNSTFASAGSSAIRSTASATNPTSIV